MIKRIFLSLGLTFAFYSIYADIEIDPQDVSQENIAEPAKKSPFSFEAHADIIGTTRISKGFYKKDRVEYGEAEAELAAVVYYCPEYTEGLRVAAAYDPTYLKWHNNPWFEQDHFNLATFTLSGFTKRAERWFWRAQLSASFDTDNWSTKYTSYDIILWGKYDLCDNIGIHLGFMAETGLQMDRIYPIIGFDWQISKKLKLSLVYPVNISLLYSITRHWSFGAAGRLFSSRFRVDQKQHSHKPLVRYSNFGVELMLQYENGTMTANIHAGTTTDGILRVADVHNNHAKNYHLNPSGYAGVEVDLKF